VIKYNSASGSDCSSFVLTFSAYEGRWAFPSVHWACVSTQTDRL